MPRKGYKRGQLTKFQPKNTSVEKLAQISLLTYYLRPIATCLHLLA